MLKSSALLPASVTFGLCRLNRVKTKSYWSRASPNPMTGVFIRSGTFGHRHTERKRRTPRDEGGKGQTCLHAMEHQGWLATMRSREEAGEDPSRDPLERARPCQHPHRRLPDSRAVREEMSVKSPSPGLSLQQPQETNTLPTPNASSFWKLSELSGFLCCCVCPSTAPSPLPKTTSPTLTIRQP